MGKNKKNKTKQSSAVTEIQNDEVSLDEVETSVIEEVIENEEIESSEEPKKVSEFLNEYNLLSTLREGEKEIRNKREEFIKAHEKEFEKRMKEFSSELKKNKRDQDVSVKKMKKLHTNEVKKASKEKRKRNGKNMGGFTTATPVPKKLVEFLGLDEGAELTRPAVFHLMSEKFAEEKLKEGQQIKLDKKNAKKLGKQAGYVIEFSKQQTFLASFYNEEKDKNVKEVDV